MFLMHGYILSKYSVKNTPEYSSSDTLFKVSELKIPGSYPLSYSNIRNCLAYHIQNVFQMYM